MVEQPVSKPADSPKELEFRRYEARLGLWKVIWGTAIVGLAGILIPGAISFYSTVFENWRKQAELEQARQSANQQYIKDFLSTALNQDVELRIRFATYFAHLSDPEQSVRWRTYLAEVNAQRIDARNDINDLEAEIAKLSNDKTAEIREMDRRLRWAYGEVGYLPPDRSIVAAPIGKKQLYDETIRIVSYLSSLTSPIDATSEEFARFWELYKKELVGIESQDVSRKMIAIGALLNALAQEKSPPNDQLRKLSDELEALITVELDSKAQGNQPAASLQQTGPASH